MLASEASDLYANIEQKCPFTLVYDVGDMLEAYARIYSLADLPQFVIPDHDPDVLRRFLAGSRAQEDWIVRLNGGIR